MWTLVKVHPVSVASVPTFFIMNQENPVLPSGTRFELIFRIQVIPAGFLNDSRAERY